MDQTNAVKRTGMIGSAPWDCNSPGTCCVRVLTSPVTTSTPTRCGAPKPTASNIATRLPKSVSTLKSSSSWWPLTNRSRASLKAQA